jgi:hypothetical protein
LDLNTVRQQYQQAYFRAGDLAWELEQALLRGAPEHELEDRRYQLQLAWDQVNLLAKRLSTAWGRSQKRFTVVET